MHEINAQTIVLVYAVTDLKVLPLCEFQALYAQPRKVKWYSGHKQVYQSKVSYRDLTWFNNIKKADKGNSVMEKGVSSCALQWNMR